MDAVLEERGIKIFIETILELDVILLPDDFISEGKFRVRREENFVFRCDVDIDYLFTIITDFKLLVCPDVVIRISYFANNAPDWQIINIHLIPVVVFDSIDKSFVFFSV